ncbi:MAG TPA: hypothetical protein VHK87_08720 [Phenylobacterium sp.]|jgi:hypothetical protein|nr:hypothetical protein [Phenylobacterium sp.]HEX2560152.1 hypothetical protein [Phenylobacterium sp.]
MAPLKDAKGVSAGPPNAPQDGHQLHRLERAVPADADLALHALLDEPLPQVGAPGPLVVDIDVEVEPVVVGGLEEPVDQRLQEGAARPRTRFGDNDPAQVHVLMRVVEPLEDGEAQQRPVLAPPGEIARARQVELPLVLFTLETAHELLVPGQPLQPHDLVDVGGPCRLQARHGEA